MTKIFRHEGLMFFFNHRSSQPTTPLGLIFGAKSNFKIFGVISAAKKNFETFRVSNITFLCRVIYSICTYYFFTCKNLPLICVAMDMNLLILLKTSWFHFYLQQENQESCIFITQLTISR